MQHIYLFLNFQIHRDNWHITSESRVICSSEYAQISKKIFIYSYLSLKNHQHFKLEMNQSPNVFCKSCQNVFLFQISLMVSIIEKFATIIPDFFVFEILLKSVFYKNVLVKTVHTEIRNFGPIDFNGDLLKFSAITEAKWPCHMSYEREF